jgi:DNA invertase Pin-like site-specific DNA recombinase
MSKKIEIDKEKFLELYKDPTNTNVKLAEYFGVSLQTVKRFIKNNGLKRTPINGMKKNYDTSDIIELLESGSSKEDIMSKLNISLNTINVKLRAVNYKIPKKETISKDELIDYYINDLHSVKETALHFNISIQTILRFIKKNDIKKTKEEITNTTKKTFENKYGKGVTTNLVLEDTKLKIKKTNLDRYGVDHPMKNKNVRDKVIKTNIERYGVDHPLQNKDIMDKAINTSMKRYNETNPMKNEEVKKHLKKSMLQRYGVDHPMKLEVFRNAIKETNKDRYGVEYPSMNEDIKVKIKETNLSKYGVEYPLLSKDILSKTRESSLEKYGVNYPLQNTDIFSKANKTLNEKYGANSPFESKEILNKSKETVLNKYGVDNVIKVKEIRDKATKTMLEKHGYEIASKTPEGRNNLRSNLMTNKDNLDLANSFSEDTLSFLKEMELSNGIKPSYNEISLITGLDISTVWHRIDKMNLKDKIRLNVGSIMEDEVKSFIHEVNPTLSITSNNWNIIKPYELDIYLPEINVAIECNPTVTHNSSKGFLDSPAKSSSYHKMKSDLCSDKGIFLFHIFGYEWSHNKDTVKSMIKNLIGGNANRIYARKTTVKEVSSSDGRLFLLENHRQKNVGSDIRLGLYLENELVSLMTFNRPKIVKDKKVDWVLNRFCSLKDTNVIGGASKLFKHFVNEYKPDKVYSYGDKAHARGNLYLKLGFNLYEETSPTYTWVEVKTDKGYNKEGFRKDKLRKKFNDESIDLSRTEKEIVEEHGYVQVFDSGKQVFVWRKE